MIVPKGVNLRKAVTTLEVDLLATRVLLCAQNCAATDVHINILSNVLEPIEYLRKFAKVLTAIGVLLTLRWGSERGVAAGAVYTCPTAVDTLVNRQLFAVHTGVARTHVCEHAVEKCAMSTAGEQVGWEGHQMAANCLKVANAIESCTADLCCTPVTGQ